MNNIIYVFRHIRNLKGSNIRVERDLSESERKNRNLLVNFKKHLLSVSKEFRVNVVECNLKIERNTFILRDGTLEARAEGQDAITFFKDKYNIDVVDYFSQST
ncbi:hypothetical protein ACFFRR_007317 [Megaselia abdita]